MARGGRGVRGGLGRATTRKGILGRSLPVGLGARPKAWGGHLGLGVGAGSGGLGLVRGGLGVTLATRFVEGSLVCGLVCMVV